jgi:hypothetical protein
VGIVVDCAVQQQDLVHQLGKECTNGRGNARMTPLLHELRQPY